MILIIGAKKWEQDCFKAKFTDVKCASKLTPAKNVEVLSVFIHTQIGKAQLDKMPNLKLIATRSTGFDHIDIGECKKRGIIVSNVPTYGENSVAEHAMALLLTLSRKIHVSHNHIRARKYEDANLVGFDLKGKTIGVIGGGHIGMHMVRMAKGFGMHVLVYDIFEQNFLKELLHFNYAPLKTLLAKSDIISMHAPYNKYTHHMINKDLIKNVKKGSVFINTARGGLIDNNVLLKALNDGTFSMAGLDVLEHEEAMMFGRGEVSKAKKDIARKIVHHPNVIFTPHNAFNSIEALQRIVDTTIDNIKAFKKSKPTNVVNQ